MKSDDEFLIPDWPTPSNVSSLITTRACFALDDSDPYAGFNLAAHVGDDLSRVESNRETLKRCFGVRPIWLSQIHSTRIAQISNESIIEAECDGSYTSLPNLACAVLTADCLPVLICDSDGTQVMCLHAGWRGLAAGILAKGVKLFRSNAELLVYLGPAISQKHFEVGEEVLEKFKNAERQRDFKYPVADDFDLVSRAQKKYMADLYALARSELEGLGVRKIYGGNFCTFEEERFYSFRRDVNTGRFASLIWLNKHPVN